MSIEDDHSNGGPEQEEAIPDSGESGFSSIPSLTIRVITDPAGFYQSMPKSGGLIDPLVFMVVLAVAAGVLSAALSLFGFGLGGVMAGGLMAIILVPILVVIFGFVGAAIAYVIWKLMGSEEDFETAFRCIAYTAAIAPVTAVLGLVPYLGSLLSALWPMALLAIASIHVHRRSEQMSWVVFGIIGALFALMNVGGERASRQMASEVQEWQDFLQE